MDSVLPPKRKLTEDEIEYILTLIPSAPRPTKEDIERAKALRERVKPFGVNLNSSIEFCEVWKTAFGAMGYEAYVRDVREHLRKQLEQIEIIPILVETLRERIMRNYNRAHIEAGTPVGIITAMSAGGQVQQATLNSFHSSGSSNSMQSGVDQIRMLINLSRNNPNPMCTVHFKWRISYLDAIRKEADLVGVTILSLCEDTSYTLMSTDTFERPWWYDLWEAVEGPMPPHNTNFLRIKLDTNKLYQYGVNIHNIVDALNSINHLGSLFFVYSPLHIGIVDIYTTREGVEKIIALPEKGSRGKDILVEDEEDADDGAPPSARDMHDVIAPFANEAGSAAPTGVEECDCPETRAHEENLNNASLVMLTTLVASFMRTHAFKGVPNVTALTPILTPVFSLVETETHLGDGKWKLDLSEYRERVGGIRREYLEHLLSMCGMSVVERGDTFMIVHNPERGKPDDWVSAFINDYKPGGDIDVELDVPVQNSGSSWTAPSASVNARIRFDKWKYQRILELEEKKSFDSAEIPREKFKRLDAAEYVTVQTTGSNLRALLERPEVDPHRTTSNSVYEIAELFGIGAARNYLLNAFQTLFSSTGSYVPPRHITLLVDFQTSRGVPLSVTYSALAKRNIHTLALATNQRSMTVFKNAAAIGKREALYGTSAQIMTNRRGTYGTGHSGIIVREDLLEKRAKELDAERAKRDRKGAETAKKKTPRDTLRQKSHSAVRRESHSAASSSSTTRVDETQYDADLIFAGSQAPAESSTLVDDLINDKREPRAQTAQTASFEEATRLVLESESGIPSPKPAAVMDPKMIEIASTMRAVPIAVGAEVEKVSTEPDKLVSSDPIEAAGLEPDRPVSEALVTRRRPRVTLPSLTGTAPGKTGSGDIASFLSNKKVDLETTRKMAERFNAQS